MKLASYKDGSRDGQLLVVSGDLSMAHYATGIATRLQQVLDDWNFLAPQLEELSQTLNHGKARHAFAFDPRRCMAPLPRAFLFAQPDGRTPLGALLERGDPLLGPGDRWPSAPTGTRLALQAQLAAMTGDVAADASAAEALEGIRLLLWAARVDSETEGVRPTAAPWAFAPVAATPDELAGAWQAGRATLGLRLVRPGAKALSIAPQDTAPLGELLAALAAGQGLRAGSIVGSGPVLPPADAPRWSGGASVQLEALDASGHSLFGAISPVFPGPAAAETASTDLPAEPAEPAEQMADPATD